MPKVSLMRWEIRPTGDRTWLGRFEKLIKRAKFGIKYEQNYKEHAKFRY